jgi:nucleoside-diphosphate-sugar epimerase
MSSLNTSSGDIYRLFNGSEKEIPQTGFWAYADVRDIATAHLLAYTTPAAANQRYMISNAPYSYQIFCDIIRKNFPDLAATTPEGDANKPLPPVYQLDTSKSITELGLKYRPIEETVVDAVNSLRELEKNLA